MKQPKTIYVYSSNRGEAQIFNLTKSQFEQLEEQDDWDTILKFEIKTDNLDCGYIPDYVCKLGEIFGFDVGSI